MVVVAYNMDRELPRALASLAPIQCGVEQLDYEIVVVDNGSTNALDCTTLSPEVIKRLRYRPLDGALRSPVSAVNEGLRMARGQLVGVMIDGARRASPGLVMFAWRAVRLHVGPGVIVRAFMADLEEFFSEIRLSVAPLRYGAGLKGKVITSLSYGVPVVATTVAVEGAGLCNDDNVLGADKPDELADAILREYGDSEQWEQFSCAGYQHFKDNFSVEFVSCRLAKLFQ